MGFGIGIINKKISKDTPRKARIKQSIRYILLIVVLIFFAASFFSEEMRKLFGMLMVLIGSCLVFKCTLLVCKWLSPERIVASPNEFTVLKLRYTFGPYIWAIIFFFISFSAGIGIEEELELSRLNKYVEASCQEEQLKRMTDENSAAYRRDNCKAAQKRITEIKTLQKQRQK